MAETDAGTIASIGEDATDDAATAEWAAMSTPMPGLFPSDFINSTNKSTSDWLSSLSGPPPFGKSGVYFGLFF